MRHQAQIIGYQGQPARAAALPLCLATALMGLMFPASAVAAQTQGPPLPQTWIVSPEPSQTAQTSSNWRGQQSQYATASGNQWTLRRAQPLASPLALSRSDTQDAPVAVQWRHSWTGVRGTSAEGLELALDPHAGIDWNDRGSSAVAGATLRVGRGLDRLAPDGDATFGQKARWYLFASGSKRAVGYNFTRDREGGFSNEGLSQDRGQSAMGDAAIGLAWRKGPLQSTLGLAYREVEIDGLRGYGGRRTDVDEGVLAFQISIRPQ